MGYFFGILYFSNLIRKPPLLSPHLSHLKLPPHPPPTPPPSLLSHKHTKRILKENLTSQQLRMSARLMAVINYRKVYREGWRGRGGGERGVKEEGKRADRGKHGDEEGMEGE